MSIYKNDNSDLQNKIKELEEKVYYQSQVIEINNSIINSQKEVIEKQKIITNNDEIIQKLDREMILLLVRELKRIHPENKHWLSNIFKPMIEENEKSGSVLPVANELLEEIKEWSETRKKIFKEEELVCPIPPITGLPICDGKCECCDERITKKERVKHLLEDLREYKIIFSDLSIDEQKEICDVAISALSESHSKGKREYMYHDAGMNCKIYKCLTCGCLLKESDNFCSHCGANMKGEKPNEKDKIL